MCVVGSGDASGLWFTPEKALVQIYDPNSFAPPPGAVIGHNQEENWVEGENAWRADETYDSVDLYPDTIFWAGTPRAGTLNPASWAVDDLAVRENNAKLFFAALAGGAAVALLGDIAYRWPRPRNHNRKQRSVVHSSFTPEQQSSAKEESFATVPTVVGSFAAVITHTVFRVLSRRK